ncbi:MAG: hypothetical protein HC918_03310 [Oscillatoriales cyanobacterium SM2_1_8]|nr:hypothetical protein [Oscillatoriales cyanobacterium SM2_1_8]
MSIVVHSTSRLGRQNTYRWGWGATCQFNKSTRGGKGISEDDGRRLWTWDCQRRSGVFWAISCKRAATVGWSRYWDATANHRAATSG